MKMHFIGINGASMSVLAEIYKNKGYIISGSDLSSGGHNAKNVHGADVVVYTSAISDDNVELVEAKRLNIKTIPRAELLGQTASQYSKTIAVSGAHGKTSTTAMLASVFAPLSPTVHIGGTINHKNSCKCGNSEYFITEACEYKRSFLHLKPTVAVVLNIALDHTDYYSCLNDMIGAFTDFCNNSSVVVINGDCGECAKIKTSAKKITFGQSAANDYYAKNIVAVDGKICFDVYEFNAFLCNICINAYGQHNVLNALAGIAAARIFALSISTITIGLNAFMPVDRRFEYIKTTQNGGKIFCDYAHHPTEIIASINTARTISPHVKVLFQPHTYSRTFSFQSEFIDALGQADEIALIDIYAAREKPIDGITSENLSKKIFNSTYLATDKQTRNFINSTSANQICLIMGAGDVVRFCKK